MKTIKYRLIQSTKKNYRIEIKKWWGWESLRVIIKINKEGLPETELVWVKNNKEALEKIKYHCGYRVFDSIIQYPTLKYKK